MYDEIDETVANGGDKRSLYLLTSVGKKRDGLYVKTNCKFAIKKNSLIARNVILK